MANYLINLSFVGTAYHGFQIQKNADTVQARLQTAIKTALGYLPDIKGCSRTDSGVHAKMYCVSLKIEGDLDSARFLRTLNALLPHDIRATGIKEVPDDFHARYSCISKEYCYLISASPALDPILYGRAAHFPREFDCESVNGTLSVLIGRHDFRAFCGIKGLKDDTTRTIIDCHTEREGQLVTLFARADGFLYNMVRIIAGAAMNAARGRLDAESLAAILSSGERSLLCPTAPAEGLYLNKVEYEFDR